MKSLWVLLSLLILAFGVWLLGAPRSLSNSEKLQLMFTQDLKDLDSLGLLPKELAEVREVQFVTEEDRPVDWISELRWPRDTKADGKYELEVLVLRWEDEANTGAIFQMSLQDKDTHNLLWELGRTYNLSEANERH